MKLRSAFLLLATVLAGAALAGPAVRTVDLVDFSENPGKVFAHRGAKCEKTVLREGDIDFVRVDYAPAAGGWGGYRLERSVPEGTTALVFRVRAETGSATSVTVLDTDDQSYKYPFAVPAGTEWRTVTVDLTAKPFRASRLRGEPDGRIHYPIVSVTIDVFAGKRFDVSGYRAVTTAGEDVLPSFRLLAVPSKEHGLWYPEDSPSYKFEMRRCADDVPQPRCVNWTLTDYWKDEVVSKGVWTTGSGPVTFPRALFGRRCGSFRLTLAAGEGAGRITRDVWMARMAGPDPEPCRWIGSLGGKGAWRLFRAMGLGTKNISVGWCDCEKQKGVYSFPPEMHDTITNLLAHGIMPHAMTHCANPIYENPLDPQAFARYAAAYARRLNELGVDNVEIWNEPRRLFRKQYGEDSRIEKFVEFSRMARDEIKKAVPGMTVTVCAEDMPFDLLPMIGRGIAQPGDAISFHPYCHTQPRPERSYFFSDNGRSIRCLARERCGTERFRISEFGWTTYEGKGKYLEVAGYYPRASYAHQAQYCVRTFLIAQQSGVEYSCQYRFEDLSQRHFTEHNFGFVFEDFTPKPSFCAVAFMARLLGKARPVGDLSPDLDSYRIASFECKDRTVLACWAVEGECRWKLPDSFGRVERAYDVMGNEIAPPFADGRILRLDERPFYLVGAKREAGR